jgi:hypothetical protein
MKQLTGFMQNNIDDEIFLCSKDTWEQWLN